MFKREYFNQKFGRQQTTGGVERYKCVRRDDVKSPCACVVCVMYSRHWLEEQYGDDFVPNVRLPQNPFITVAGLTIAAGIAAYSTTFVR